MSEQALRKHLEFYRDLGFDELFVGAPKAGLERASEDPGTDPVLVRRCWYNGLPPQRCLRMNP